MKDISLTESLRKSCTLNAVSVNGSYKIQSTVSFETITKVLILVIMSNGIIANFAPSIGINAGTICIDILVLMIFGCAIVREAALSSNSKRCLIPDMSIFSMFLLIIIFTLMSVLVVGYYGPGLLGDLRIRFLYYLIAPALFVLLKDDEVHRVLRFFINCGTLFCCFAIAQALIPDALGPKLTSVQYDGTLGLSWSEASSSLTLRSNALMGNAIEFGGVCVMLFALAMTDLFRRGISIIRIIKVIIIAAGCYLSYSRVACAGLVVISAILYFRFYNSRSGNKALNFIILTTALLIAGYLMLGNSLLMNRFFGEDTFTQASNLAHQQNTIKAFQVINDNLLFGTGLGTQVAASTRVTGDGWWFQLAAETGIIVLILYLSIYFRIFIRLWECQKNNVGLIEELSFVLLVILMYYFCSSFINSSFAGRADFSLFMCLTGLLLAASNGKCSENSKNSYLTEMDSSID